MQDNESILEEMKELRVKSDTELPEENPILSIDGIPIFERGDIGAVKGKQKSGKSTVLKVMIAAWMKGSLFRLKSEKEEAKVIYIDTEQKLQDVKKIVDDVIQLSGCTPQYVDSHLQIYSVRTLSYKVLFERTNLLVKSYRPDVIIIDGIVDYVSSFNDEEASHRLINELVVLCDLYRCTVLCVLHTNKAGDDHNMRGHLGTMMAQKAGIVIECSKHGDVITVSCSDSRHQTMPDWQLTYDGYGHIVDPQDDSKPVVTPAMKLEQDRQEKIRSILQAHGGQMSRKELTEKLQAALNLSRTTVSNFITKQLSSILTDANGLIQLASEPELPFVV